MTIFVTNYKAGGTPAVRLRRARGGVEGGAPAGERRAQAQGQLAADRRAEKIADHQALAVRGDDEPVRPVGPLLQHDAQPERLKPPDKPLAVDVDPLDG